MARAKSGDGGALGVLVERHHAALFRTALAILGDDDDAADAAQGAVLRAAAALAGFRGESSFRTWLLRIGTNEARALMRRKARRRQEPVAPLWSLAEEGTDPAESAVRRTEIARMEAALARLPEKQRLAVTLRIYEGLSFREVGQVLGSSEGAARVNYHHGLRKLRESLR